MRSEVVVFKAVIWSRTNLWFPSAWATITAVRSAEIVVVEAERIGEHATCSACGAYARFKLISASQARCRKCNHEWRLIEPE